MPICYRKESPQQVADAVQMGRYASTHKVNHVMLLGDNFYESGVHGDCHNCRFQKTFESVYDASSLKDIPFYAIAGNHDHGGNVSAQIAYSKVSSRWKYPDWYYTFTENFTDPVAGKSVTVQFIMIDTVIGASGDGVYGEEQLGEFPEVPYPANAPTAAQQLAWAEMEMARSTADYLWLAGHYPVWSGCSHGNDETMNTVYKPLIEKYHLTGYMSGHDHCEEHIDEGKGPAYVLTGSGFECCYKGSNADKVPEGAIKFAYWDGDCPAGAKCPPKSKNSAFAVFTASATEMVVEYIDSAGKSLYTSPPMKPRSTTQKGVTPSAAE